MAHHIMSSGRIELMLRAPEGDQRKDPFAPPTEGAPDRPWQPRGPRAGRPGPGPVGHGPRAHGPEGTHGGPGSGDSGSGSGQGSGSGSGSGSGDGSGPDSGDGSSGPSGPYGPPDSSGGGGTPPPPPPAWGSQWSSRQPQSGRPDPFQRPPQPGGPQGTGPRFDPTDPAQRRSRYALVCGGWGLIFALFGWTPVGLLLGALALYWGISALRMTPEERETARASAASALADAAQSPRPAPPAPGPDAQRSFMTAAWTGIVTSAVALAIVAATYGFQLAYRDYYTCKSDALTSPASHSCSKLLPGPLRDLPAFRS